MFKREHWRRQAEESQARLREVQKEAERAHEDFMKLVRTLGNLPTKEAAQQYHTSALGWSRVSNWAARENALKAAREQMWKAMTNKQRLDFLYAESQT